MRDAFLNILFAGGLILVDYALSAEIWRRPWPLAVRWLLLVVTWATLLATLAWGVRRAAMPEGWPHARLRPAPAAARPS